MELQSTAIKHPSRIILAVLPNPYKVLTTCIIATLAFGMLGALGQTVVHDIIPTFYSETENGVARPHADMTNTSSQQSRSKRGDLFANLSTMEPEKRKPFYKDEQFVWTLRWTHIHLFGINMIFIFLGLITALLDAGSKLRTWLIALPFIGVLIDILSICVPQKGSVEKAIRLLDVSVSQSI